MNNSPRMAVRQYNFRERSVNFREQLVNFKELKSDNAKVRKDEEDIDGFGILFHTDIKDNTRGVKLLRVNII